ncbi:DUF58 domain-containing protein [Lacimicrobium sp. SS2-24]|uniref:DUF58 domain-containing protein n=1 Tax=Lacimicrobium sp. SS2-24 TaxID=2005569 RepID=UPI000B4AE16B|nr:DUF58 domain-containing protein [Lacimicrobium sp. SS2-24]
MMFSKHLSLKITQWLDKRIPPATDVSLHRRNIFIFPSRFGFLFLVLCVALFILGTNYQNNLILILAFFLLGLFLVSLFNSYLNFSGLRIVIGKVGYPFAGDSANVPLWIETTTKKQTAHGRLHIALYGKNVQLSVDLDRLTNPVDVAVPTSSRGPQAIPRITLSSFYPLGLFRCWTHLQFASTILVYPSPHPCSVVTYDESGEENQEGPVSDQQGHDDFHSLTEYQPGQPLYHVAWKQVAKGQGMISKKFSGSSEREIWLRLTTSSGPQREADLSRLCFMVLELDSQGYRFGLELGDTLVPPAQGNHHRHQCLKALALYGFSEVSHE